MAKMRKVSFSYSTCKFWYHPYSIVVCHAAQQSVHWTLGTAASRRVAPTAGIFLASSFFSSQALSTPAPAPVPHTVGWQRSTKAWLHSEGTVLVGHSILVLVENRNSSPRHFPDYRRSRGKAKRFEHTTGHDYLWSAYEHAFLHVLHLSRQSTEPFRHSNWRLVCGRIDRSLYSWTCECLCAPALA
jgi:hypothetical protein